MKKAEILKQFAYVKEGNSVTHPYKHPIIYAKDCEEKIYKFVDISGNDDYQIENTIYPNRFGVDLYPKALEALGLWVEAMEYYILRAYKYDEAKVCETIILSSLNGDFERDKPTKEQREKWVVMYQNLESANVLDSLREIKEIQSFGGVKLYLNSIDRG